MLTLNRLAGEAVFIGPIRVIFTRIKDSGVRVKIDAPDHLPILRAELPQHDERLYKTDFWEFKYLGDTKASAGSADRD